jgi:signal transduction histidine kinase
LRGACLWHHDATFGVFAVLASRYVGAVLVGLALCAAPIIDLFILGSGHLIASLYGVPILLAAPLWRPRTVAAVSAVAVGLHAAAGALQYDDLELWLLYALSLLMIAALGVLLSVQRQQTERRARDAEVASQQLQTFISMVAHELATPVTGVIGRAQLALRRARRSREQRALVAIEAEAQQIAHLVNDLRDAARAGAGRFEIDSRVIELVALVSHVVERQRQPNRRRDILLTGVGALAVTCDPERIGQVIGNLVSNALKYSPAEAPVRIDILADGGEAVIAVTDSGIGIPDVERDRLFQPFSRLSGARGFVGTGLGLYISRAIVEAHGGTIDVVSVEGRGSTFTVRLPAVADSVADIARDDTVPA